MISYVCDFDTPPAISAKGASPFGGRLCHRRACRSDFTLLDAACRYAHNSVRITTAVAARRGHIQQATIEKYANFRCTPIMTRLGGHSSRQRVIKRSIIMKFLPLASNYKHREDTEDWPSMPADNGNADVNLRDIFARNHAADKISNGE